MEVGSKLVAPLDGQVGSSSEFPYFFSVLVEGTNFFIFIILRLKIEAKTSSPTSSKSSGDHTATCKAESCAHAVKIFNKSKRADHIEFAKTLTKKIGKLNRNLLWKALVKLGE